MALIDEARTLAAVTLHGPDCSVRKAQAQHPKLADEIADVIRDRGISSGVAETIFARHNVDLSAGTVERHRNNRCINCRKHEVVW